MDDDLHFSRYRREQARRMDAEYRQWLAERRGAQADTPRATPAPHTEGPLEAMGRAVSEAVTGSLPPGRTRDGKPR